MELKKITPDEFQVSVWSGGKTEQIAIDPPGSVYAERKFNFRLSSATVEQEESDFTLLPDYNRIIAPIHGRLSLFYRESGEAVVLSELEFSRFDGGWHTHSKGRVTDYNLMTRKGVCSGGAAALTLAPGQVISLPAPEPSSGGRRVRLIWCAEGSARIEFRKKALVLASREALQMDWNGSERDGETRIRQTGKSSARLMMATVRFL